MEETWTRLDARESILLLTTGVNLGSYSPSMQQVGKGQILMKENLAPIQASLTTEQVFELIMMSLALEIKDLMEFDQE